MEETKRNIKEICTSFKCAFRGVKYAISHERNFQIEIISAFSIVALILIFDIKSWEAVVLFLMIMWILVVELVNTVVEKVVDILKPRVHPYARLIKDMMAAVVLISAVFVAAIGIIIFYPYLRDLFIFAY
ncbi:MAG: diacylglycerol kinase [Parcubacteria group bacterium]|jgi:diacylglycerol kinase